MGELIERRAETAAIESFVRDVGAGRGRSMLLTGPAGIGKSTLVRWAQQVASARGFAVLAASPTPVSTGISHGVVRDWLAPLVRAGRPGTKPFDGPAEPLAQSLLDPAGSPEVLTLARLDYALTWALESLAETRAVLLVVDDVQWCDVGSLQLIDLLSARLGSSAVGLLLAQRSGAPCLAPSVLERIAGRASVLAPPPLSVLGVEQMRRQSDPGTVGRRIPTHELHRLTGGVPFLVAELLRSGDRDGVPRAVVDSVTDRLDLLDDSARAVATTTAALGEEATFDALAELTGLTVAELADPLEVLADAGILELGMWQARPAHPLVAEAILSSLTPSERSDLHHGAAAYLQGQGRPNQVIASHLVHTLPREDPAVVELLRAAGEESLRAGASEVAASQLLRAVGETRPEDTDTGLLALTASAHVLAGRREEALDLWRRARQRIESPEELAVLLADVADVQMTMGERGLAAASYREAVAALSHTGHDSASPHLRRLLVRMGMVRALYEGARAEIADAVIDAVTQPPDQDTHTDRLLFALAASDLAVRGEDHRRSRAFALRAMGDGALLEEESPEGIGFYVASGALSWADAYEENLRVLEAAVQESRRRGSVLGFAMASYCQGLCHLRQGRLREATVDFQKALEMRAQGWPDFGDHAVAGAAMTFVGLGQYDAALALEPELRRAAGRGQFVSAHPMIAAGVVRAATGDHEQALEDYRQAAALMGRFPDNPSIGEWRELSAWSLLALGRTAEAEALAREALTHARRWGAPRSLGFALRTLARVSDREQAVPLLREAVDLLAGAGCLDYHARAAIDLGQHLLTGSAAERQEGLALLGAALEFGREADIPPVVRRAAGVLVGAGVKVADAVEPATALLTPGERRVVELAARGETNRRIAQQLFVTVKAVEWHLSNAYRKLGIRSRGELAAALYGESGPSSSSDM